MKELKNSVILSEMNLLQFLKTKFDLYLLAISLVFSLFDLFLNRPSNISLVLFILLVLLRICNSMKLNLKSDTILVLTWIYFELSITLFPIFYGHRDFYNTYLLGHTEYLFLGHKMLCFLLLTIFATSFISKRKEQKLRFDIDTKWSNVIIGTTIFVAFLMSILAWKLRVGIAMVPDPVLPFKLVSILNISKNTIIPALFFLFTIYSLKTIPKVTRINILFVFLMLGWIAVETIIKDTRGLFVLTTFKFILFFIMAGILDWKKIFFVGIVGTVITFPMYVAVTKSRLHAHDQVSTVTILKETIEDFKTPLPLYEVYFRFFGSSFELIKFQNFFEKNKLGAQYKEVIKIGDGTKYHSKTIDHVLEGVPNSSGVTALGDGYLFGKSYGVYATVLLIVGFALILNLNLINFLSNGLIPMSLSAYFLFLTYFGGEGIWSLFMRNPFFWVSLLFIYFFTYFFMNFNSLKKLIQK